MREVCGGGTGRQRRERAAPRAARRARVRVKKTMASAVHALNRGSSALQRHYALLQLGQKSDEDAIASAHRFLWPEIEEEQRNAAKPRRQWGDAADPEAGLPWEVRLARRYYRKLHREYALADMTRYREGAIGLRWRTEKELVDGKGQFTCGNKACGETEHLDSFELLFAYAEHGEQKQALVKLRACPKCADKLHYRKRKEERRSKRRAEKEERRKQRKERKRRRRERGDHSRERDDESEADEDDEEADVGSGPAGATSSNRSREEDDAAARDEHARAGADREGAAHSVSERGTSSCTSTVTVEGGEDALFSRLCRELIR